MITNTTSKTVIPYISLHTEFLSKKYDYDVEIAPARVVSIDNKYHFYTTVKFQNSDSILVNHFIKNISQRNINIVIDTIEMDDTIVLVIKNVIDTIDVRMLSCEARLILEEIHFYCGYDYGVPA